MATEAAPAPAPSQVRPRREREEELLVWPDLVFVEFICAVLFTLSFTAMSAVVNAPLINRANADITPNPSKAPWYFLNLQELLLHMNPAWPRRSAYGVPDRLAAVPTSTALRRVRARGSAP